MRLHCSRCLICCAKGELFLLGEKSWRFFGGGEILAAQKFEWGTYLGYPACTLVMLIEQAVHCRSDNMHSYTQNRKPVPGLIDAPPLWIECEMTRRMAAQRCITPAFQFLC
jgi:hypothetical protein